MLYTVVPLEQIYNCRTKMNSNKAVESENDLEFKDISLEHGFVRARREQDHYVIDGIHSTNMKDYLDDKLSIGSILDI